MARRRLAEVRRASRLLRLHVGLSRQEAAVHGPGIRASGDEWSEAAEPRLASARSEPHKGMQTLIARPQPALPSSPALHARDCEPEGFEWLIADDDANSVFAWVRQAGEASRPSRSFPTSRRCRATATACPCRGPGAGARGSTPMPRPMAARGCGNLRQRSRRAPSRRHGQPAEAESDLAAAGDLDFRIFGTT